MRPPDVPRRSRLLSSLGMSQTLSTKHSSPSALREVAGVFLRLGFTAFGGPAAHIALMEDEVVRRRRWLTREQFLDLLGATNLIPGPNSTELAIHIGHARAGWHGLFVARRRAPSSHPAPGFAAAAAG